MCEVCSLSVSSLNTQNTGESEARCSCSRWLAMAMSGQAMQLPVWRDPADPGPPPIHCTGASNWVNPALQRCQTSATGIIWSNQTEGRSNRSTISVRGGKQIWDLSSACQMSFGRRWKRLKDTANNVIGKRHKTTNKPWITEETLRLMDNRKSLKANKWRTEKDRRAYCKGQWCGLRPSVLGQDRSETKNRSWSWYCRFDVVLWNTFCFSRCHNNLEKYSNFSSRRTIYSFSVLCLEHHCCGDQQWRLLT